MGQARVLPIRSASLDNITRTTGRTANMARKHAHLDEYRRKRDFTRTPEPETDPPGDARGRRFVVQKHDASQLHYDVRLEMHGVLWSWAVPRGPSLDPTRKQLAVRTEDHPLAYADFEGVIPEGEYGGGTVMIWDRGTWEPIGDPDEAYAKGDLKFRLLGAKLRGEWVLAQMTSSEDPRNWLLIKKRDAESRPIEEFNVLAQRARSAASGRTMKAIAEAADRVWTEGAESTSADGTRSHGSDWLGLARIAGATKGEMPEMLSPQLASQQSTPPDGDEWIHEVKLDGYRLIAIVRGGSAKLLTRNGHDWTVRFPSVAHALSQLPIDAILDGEVIAPGADGKPSFHALQRSMRARDKGVTYYAFDLPFAGGTDLRGAALRDRKLALERILDAIPLAPDVRLAEAIDGAGRVVFEQAIRSGLEGIVSKRRDSTYESRRSRSWIKVKGVRRQEVVVGGYTKPERGRSGFRGLLVGYYGDGELVFCGSVGSGFSEDDLINVCAELDAMPAESSPFATPVPPTEAKHAVWTQVSMVIEVEFSAWTDGGMLRHPVFRGIRRDIDARDVRRERTDGADVPMQSRSEIVRAVRPPADGVINGVRITHPDRVVYPEEGITKLEVARYYQAVAAVMLPHIQGRALSLVRCPLGLAGESFYQRSLGDGMPEAIKGVTLDDDEERSIYIEGEAGLLGLVQMGVLEIHPWGSRIDAPGKPDRLIFDLDPGPGIEWEHIAASAVFLRNFLDDLGLASYFKTSGGSGGHVVVPIIRRGDWDEAKAFTRGIAKELVRLAPRNFVAVMTKSLRKNRVFIDYLRNTEGATAVSAYSTRARNGACVSTPVCWEELESGVNPDAFNVRTVAQRVAAIDDPWSGFDRVRQSVTKDAMRAVGMEC